MTKPSKPTPPKNSSPVVRIDIYSAVALVDPPVPMLETYLTSTVQRFAEGGPQGYQQREEAVEMYATDFRYRTVIAAGQVQRVQQILTDHGYKVKLTDHRLFGDRFAVDKKLVRGLQGDDRRLANAVRREPLGQIEVKNFTDLILTMRLIVDLYPKARVLILVATRVLAKKIRWKLDDAALNFDVRLMGRSWPKNSPRCMVSTFTPMGYFRPDAWDIVLLPDPGGTVGTWNTKAMAGTLDYSNKDSLRVYSFVQAGTRLGRRGQIRLEAISGPVIYRLAGERAGARALWLPAPDSSIAAKDSSTLAYKRAAYWHNGNRNTYIAAVAKAFVNRDARKLSGYGIPFHGDEPVLRHAPNTKVAVLVASTEQATEISKRLPRWVVQNAVPGNKPVNAAGKPVGGTLGTIITETAAGQHGLDADVVIRAGGSTGMLCFQDFPPEVDKDTRNVLVVDFSDGFHERAAQDAQRRRKEYEAAGWESTLEPGKKAGAGKK